MYWAYSSYRQNNGWYPGLYYKTVLRYPNYWDKPDQWDAIVSDVHTDLPSPDIGDSGAVLHEGVGNVHLMMIAVDNGADRMVYAGPVLSHYEFEMPGTTRLTDSDWKTMLRNNSAPASPSWTRSYLVLGTISILVGY